MIDAICRRAQQHAIAIQALLIERQNTHQCVFYADDGFLGGTDKYILGEMMNKMVEDFSTVGLQLNVQKTKTMVSTIQPKNPRRDQDIYWRSYGNERTYSQREWLMERVQCSNCSKIVQRKRRCEHMHLIHGILEEDTNDQAQGNEPKKMIQQYLGNTKTNGPQCYTIDRLTNKCPVCAVTCK